MAVLELCQSCGSVRTTDEPDVLVSTRQHQLCWAGVSRASQLQALLVAHEHGRTLRSSHAGTVQPASETSTDNKQAAAGPRQRGRALPS